MSTQQIPSATQIAAARSVLWHQNTPEPVVAGPFDSTNAQDYDIIVAPTPVSPEGMQETEPSELGTEPIADYGESESADAGVDEAVEHPGIDVSDPEASLPQETSVPVAPSVAILTLSGAREFLNRAGLLLFAAKPQFSGVPAPTFVEATLGGTNANPSLTASATARALLARLVADGSAIPLNLLGLPSTTAEAPDFIASAAAFPYIFTLRGDKAWKQPPATSGATKVSPLAANTYTLLVENGSKSAYDLVGDLGKEVTEAAVLRALSELWQQLRVIPVPQPGGKPTLWEPITTRFTKQIKTGANAGQPTALSTFVSLFLGQAILATEDEIETFLSPLAPRSRVRDVLHALSGARQLETITVEGKHHLHISGDLPLFESTRESDVNDIPVLTEDGSRIKKFVSKPRKLGTGTADRPKPFRAPSDRSRPDSRPDRRDAGDRFAAKSVPPTFNKPWDEEKQARADRVAAATDGAAPDKDTDLDAGTRPERPRPAGGRPAFGSKSGGFGRKPAFGSKPAYGDRSRSGGDRPAFQRDRPASDRPAFNRDRPSFSGNHFSGDRSSQARPAFSRDRPGGDRPAFHSDRNSSDRPAFNRDRPSFSRAPREGGSDRFQPRDSRRDFTSHSGAGDSRPPRQFGNKPGFGGKPSFGSKPSFPRKPFDPERSAGDRERLPFRRDNAAPSKEDSRPPRRSFDSGARAGGSDSSPVFAGKPRFSRDRDAEVGGRPPFRKFDAPRTPRPSRDGDGSRPPQRFGSDRSAPSGGGFAGSKSFGSKPFSRREGSDSAPRREGFSPRAEGSSFPRREGGFPPRREGGFAGKKPFGARPASNSGAGKPFRPSRSAPDAPGAGTFDKFKGNAKPWGKRPPARKYKPKGDEA